MTPKEEATELINKFSVEFSEYGIGNVWTKSSAKKYALILVDRILKVLDDEWTKIDFWTEELAETIEHWEKVKQEIENYK